MNGPSRRTGHFIKQLSPLDIIRLNSLDCINGPADVVKELIENSLDAGATSIQVFYSYYGYREIAVYDNGSGIAGSGQRENFDVIANSNSTSKVRIYEDIFSVGTYGFRGNSLMWISLKGELQIFSRCESNAVVLRAIYVNGGLLSIVPIRREDEDYVLRSFVGHTKIDLTRSFTIMIVSNLSDSFQESEMLLSAQRSELEDVIRRYSIPHYDKEFLLYDTDLGIPIVAFGRKVSMRDRLFDVRRDIFASVATSAGQNGSSSPLVYKPTNCHLLVRSSTLYISEEEILHSPFYVAIKKKRSESVLSITSDMRATSKMIITNRPLSSCNNPSSENNTASTSFGQQTCYTTLPIVPEVLWYSDAVVKGLKEEQDRLVPSIVPMLTKAYTQETVHATNKLRCYSLLQQRSKSVSTAGSNQTNRRDITATLRITVYADNPIIQPHARTKTEQDAILHGLILGKPFTNENLAILLYYNNRPIIMKRLIEEIHMCVNSYFKEIRGPNLLLVTIDTIQGTCFCDLDRTPEKKFIAFGRLIGRLIQDRVLRVMSLIFSRHLRRKRVHLSEHQRLVAKATMFHDALDIGTEASSHALRLLGELQSVPKVDPATFLDFDYQLNAFFEKCTKYLYEKIFESATNGEYHSGVSNLDARAATKHINNNVIVKTIKLYKEDFKMFDPYAKTHRDISKEVTREVPPTKVQVMSKASLSANAKDPPSYKRYTLRSDMLPLLNSKINSDVMRRVINYDFKLLNQLGAKPKKNYKAMFLSTYLLYGIQYALIKSFSIARPDLVYAILQLSPQINTAFKNKKTVPLKVLMSVFNAINNSATASQIRYSKICTLSTYQESKDWISEATNLSYAPSNNLFALKMRESSEVHPVNQRSRKKPSTAMRSAGSTSLRENSSGTYTSGSRFPVVSHSISSVSSTIKEAKEVSVSPSDCSRRFSMKANITNVHAKDLLGTSEQTKNTSCTVSSKSSSQSQPTSPPLQRSEVLKLSNLIIPSDDLFNDELEETHGGIEAQEASDNETTEPYITFSPVREAEKLIEQATEQAKLTLSSTQHDVEIHFQNLKNFAHIFSLSIIRSRFHHLENHVILVLEEELRKENAINYMIGISPRETQTIKGKQHKIEKSEIKRDFFTEKDIKEMGKQRMDVMSDALLTDEPPSLARINSYIQKQKKLTSKAELNTGNFIGIDHTIYAYYNLDNYCCNLNATKITTRLFKIIFLKYWLGNAIKTLYDPAVSLHKIALARIPPQYNIFVESFIDLFLVVGVGIVVADSQAVTIASAGTTERTFMPSQNCIQLLVHPLLLVDEHYQCFRLLYEYNKAAIPSEAEFVELLSKLQSLVFYDHLETPEPTRLSHHQALRKRLGILTHGHPIRIENQEDVNYVIPYSDDTIKAFIHCYCEFLAAHFVRMAYETKSMDIIKAYFSMIIEHLSIKDLDTPYKMPVFTENETSATKQCL